MLQGWVGVGVATPRVRHMRRFTTPQPPTDPRTRPLNPPAFTHDTRATPRTEEPFFRPGDFGRQDDSNDARFYDNPRLVTHIDDPAVLAFGEVWNLRLLDVVCGLVGDVWVGLSRCPP